MEEADQDQNLVLGQNLDPSPDLNLDQNPVQNLAPNPDQNPDPQLIESVEILAVGEKRRADHLLPKDRQENGLPVQKDHLENDLPVRKDHLENGRRAQKEKDRKAQREKDRKAQRENDPKVQNGRLLRVQNGLLEREALVQRESQNGQDHDLHHVVDEIVVLDPDRKEDVNQPVNRGQPSQLVKLLD